MKLDFNLIPNIQNLDPKFRKSSFDPTGEFHVIKDFGITMFFYQNTVVKPSSEPKNMKDFYDLLVPYVSKGRTNVLDGAEEVVPLAAMALGYSANTDVQAELDDTQKFLLSIRKGVTTVSSFGYINDAIGRQDHPEPGLERRRAPDPAGAQEGGRHHGDHPHREVRGVGRQLVRPGDAPHPVAALVWIAGCSRRRTVVTEMEYHSYPIPIPAALDQMPADIKNDPIFNVPSTYTDNYEYILNPNPQLVNARTKIYQQFKAACERAEAGSGHGGRRGGRQAGERGARSRPATRPG